MINETINNRYDRYESDTSDFMDNIESNVKKLDKDIKTLPHSDESAKRYENKLKRAEARIDSISRNMKQIFEIEDENDTYYEEYGRN
jgi:uncharacterized protein Yka (UPF0111/DUF47 family)